MNSSLARYWLLLGTGALAVAGLFSIVLVVARTPALAALPLFADMFHKALVVHVDLSVLVWFLAMAGMLWSMAAGGRRRLVPYTEEAALISMLLGMLAIAASAFDPGGAALMSNYIPVITSPLFFIGLALVMCGLGLMAMMAPFSGAAFIALMALAAFVWSYRQMPAGLAPQDYYDTLFWGGGHVLQFLHVKVVMLYWIMLTKALKKEFSI